MVSGVLAISATVSLLMSETRRVMATLAPGWRDTSNAWISERRAAARDLWRTNSAQFKIWSDEHKGKRDIIFWVWEVLRLLADLLLLAAYFFFLFTRLFIVVGGFISLQWRTLRQPYFSSCNGQVTFPISHRQ